MLLAGLSGTPVTPNLSWGRMLWQWGESGIQNLPGQGRGGAQLGHAGQRRQCWDLETVSPSLTIPPQCILCHCTGEEGAGSAEGSSCGDGKTGQTAEPGEGSEN